MKNKNRLNRATQNENQTPAGSENIDPLSIVEHVSIAAFLKRCPRRFHFDEITRFGDKVGRAAESLHISYHTQIDGILGQVRVFPVGLMERVYDVMAKQYTWPAFEKAQDDADSKENEKVKRQLDAAAQMVNDPAIAEALGTVRAWFAKQAEGVSTDVPPLRSV